MNDRTRRLGTVVLANVSAPAAAIAVGVGSGQPLAVAAPLSILAGVGGWFVGTGLGTVLSRVHKQASYAPPGRPVYAFGELPPADASNAGGKGRSLSLMTQAGHPVPDGCVLMPQAFDGDDLTPDARTALGLHLTRLRRRGPGRFAVRSSAMAEDSGDASFAGEFESVIDVRTDAEIVGAIAKVRRSRHGERVRAYSSAHGLDVSHDVAVVVQKLVDAELSGVLFTVHPLTGDLCTMLGNLVEGMGEALVSGSVSASEFTLHRPDGAYGGPEGLRVLAKRLHDEAHEIEDTLGGPQDIEWAVADGRLAILQARPITTLRGWDPETADRNDSRTGTCLWSATNLSEASPEALTPLTISSMDYKQNHGGPTMKVKGREMAGYIGGRPYANLTVQLTARGRKAAADPRRTYRAMAGWWGDVPDAVPIPLLPLTKADFQRLGVGFLATGARMLRARGRVGSFVRENPGACRALQAEIAAASTPEELLRIWYDEVLPGALKAFWAVIASGSDGQVGVERDLRDLVGPDDATALMSNLSGLAGGLESLGPSAGLQQVLTGQLSRDDYLERYGFRGPVETELACPRPSEQPGWLDAALEGIKDAPDLDLMRERQARRFDQAWQALKAAHPRRARGIRRTLAKTAERAALREAARSESVRRTGVERAFDLRAGEFLGIGDGVFYLTIEELLDALGGGDRSAFARIPLRREVHQRYLSIGSLPSVIVGRFDPLEWAADPNRRTDVFVAGGPLRPVDAETAGAITGTPGALGVVEGTVRLLDGIEDSDQLQVGEVLVTHLTNIGWTPLFPRAAAIVTDLGAPLSHAAIVAREYGIPAVVGCGDATRRLSTGDHVRVDGGRGTVELLDQVT